MPIFLFKPLCTIRQLHKFVNSIETAPVSSLFARPTDTMSRLLTLPTELILEIVENLEDPCDLLALRLTHELFNVHFEMGYYKIITPETWQLSLGSFWEPALNFCNECADDKQLRVYHPQHTTFEIHLDYAICHDYLRFARHLLSTTPPLDRTLDSQDRTHEINLKGWCRALQKAAKLGSAEMIQLLLDHGANIDTHFQPTGTALHMAAKHGNLEAVKLLTERGASTATVHFGRTPLRLAVEGHHVEIVEYLLEKGAMAHIDRQLQPESEVVLQPIHAAACRSGGNTGWCQRMLSVLLKYNARVDELTGSLHSQHLGDDFCIEPGLTVLHHIALRDRRDCGEECAVGFGGEWVSREELWELLVARGADENKKGRWGRTALNERQRHW